ncbi:MAG: zinc ribbon domain-containing protein [Bacteroidales bacterium]|nr:zinc ribbon domain-containing protein [Bacteroidales bacterium]
MKNSKSEIVKAARFCPECGFKLENGAMFCPNCGTKIDLPQITKQMSSVGKADVTTKGKTTCPYCGEEILETAKKCKHCGEWLEREEQECSEENIDALQQQQNSMRSAIEEAQWNESNSGALPIQAGIIAIVMGIIFKSWWVGLGTFFGFFILIMLPRIGIVVCVLLSLFYGYIGYVIGALFSTAAGWVIGIIIGLASLSINLSSRKWFKDF